MLLPLTASLLLVTAVDGRMPMSVEHVVLPATPTAVVVDSLGGRITLFGIGDAAVARTASRSRICPETVRLAEGAPLQLQCRSRRLVVELRGATLRIRTTLWPPITTDESAPPATVYAPEVYDLGGPCPGDTPSARGECALARGNHVEAARAFREIWTGRGSNGVAVKPDQAVETPPPVVRTGPAFAHAALRLGDLAWWSGDVDSATGWYDRAGAGVFARIASSRLCELATDCIDGPTDRLRFDPWDLGGLPDPMAREITLRRARALAFLDRLDDSVRLLLASSMRWPDLCDGALPLCRKIAAEALWARRDRDAPEALALSLSISRPFEGPGAVNLARAVLHHTDRLGAPRFGANVLAAVSAQVPRSELAMHLATTATRYLEAGDPVRAGIVIDFASARGLAHHGRWREIRTWRRRLETGDVSLEPRPQKARVPPSTIRTDKP
jgi:hypothetical protein